MSPSRLFRYSVCASLAEKLPSHPTAAQAEGVQRSRESPALFPFVPGRALPTFRYANGRIPRVPIQLQHDLHAMRLPSMCLVIPQPEDALTRSPIVGAVRFMTFGNREDRRVRF